MHVLTRRTARLLAASCVAAAGLSAVTPGTAGAATGSKTWNLLCMAQLAPPPAPPLSQAQEVAVDVVLPDSVVAGSTFQISLPGGDATLPGTALGGALTITQFTDLSVTHKVTGATLTGVVAADGAASNNGAVLPSTSPLIDIGAGTFKPFTPGPVFPGTLHSPTINFEAVAGPAGSSVSISAVQLTTTATITGVGPVPVTCDISGDPITAGGAVLSIPIVAPPPPPPPPGAPTAANDVTSTQLNTAVTVDVLANDTPADADTAIDKATLRLLTNPANGTATVTADSKITYTPNTGFTGTNTFQYEICSIDKPEPTTTTTEAPTTTTTIEEEEEIFEAAAAAPGFIDGTCHFANVDIEVKAPVVAATAAPATTVAPAAQLPVTGGSPAPLGLLAVAFIGFGLALARGRTIAGTRRHQRA